VKAERETSGIPPLRAEDVAPGVAAAIERADAMIDEALALADDAPFDEVFERIDHAARIVGQAYGQFALPSQLHPDEGVRDAATEAGEALERWAHGLALRPGMAARVARFTDRGTELDDQQRAVLGKWALDLRDAGADLALEERDELARLRDIELSAPGRFFPALLVPVEIRVEADELAGVPDSIVALFGEPDGSGGWTVALTDPIFNGVLETASNRALRERVARGWHSRGYPQTTAIMQELTTARSRVARLLGYPSWMELRAPRMAIGGTTAIDRFFRTVEAPLRQRAAAELEAMRRLLVAETGDPGAVVEEWDWRYLDACQRAAIGVDPQALRDYLPFEDVLAGMFAAVESVFGVRTEPRPDRTAWHPDVRSFDLVDRDDGTLIGHLYVDPFARPGKAGNAYMDLLDPGDPGRYGEPRTPAYLLGTNAPQPVTGASTLGFIEVDQLFHEFGHVLDFALDRASWRELRDDWIEFDWVEGPSLFLGRWGQQAAVLKSFARHVVTREAIPDDLLDALARLESLNAGIRALRYLSMGRLDMLLHGSDPIPVTDADRLAWADRGMPFVEGSSFVGTFLHIVHGYDGAAYGFLWDQALRDDIFTAFSADLTSPETGKRYRASVLEAPWTEPPLEGLRGFLGRDWSAAPMLDRIATTE
jgi:Zn-dependent oligopeptidase